MHASDDDITRLRLSPSWIKDITSYMNPAIILGIMLGFQNDRIYKEVPSLEEFLDL